MFVFPKFTLLCIVYCVLPRQCQLLYCPFPGGPWPGCCRTTVGLTVWLQGRNSSSLPTGGEGTVLFSICGVTCSYHVELLDHVYVALHRVGTTRPLSSTPRNPPPLITSTTRLKSELLERSNGLPSSCRRRCTRVTTSQ